MRDHHGCGRHDNYGPWHNFGPFCHDPRGPPPFVPHFGPHCHGLHGHHRHHGPFGHGHGHGHGHRHGHHGHHRHHGPHREFDFFGPRFWGPWARFNHSERPGGNFSGPCGERSGGHSRGTCGGRANRGPEDRRGCSRNRDGPAEETVLVRGIVIERESRPKSV